MQSKGRSRVFSNTTVQKHQFFDAQLSMNRIQGLLYDNSRNAPLNPLVSSRIGSGFPSTLSFVGDSLSKQGMGPTGPEVLWCCSGVFLLTGEQNRTTIADGDGITVPEQGEVWQSDLWWNPVRGTRLSPHLMNSGSQRWPWGRIGAWHNEGPRRRRCEEGEGPNHQGPSAQPAGP